MIDDIFLAQILGHKLLGPNASLSVGQSYNDFYVRKPCAVPVEKKGHSTYDSGGRSLRGKALRRIRKAEETGAVELDLGGLGTLNRLPPELERLTSLQSLYLMGGLAKRLVPAPEPSERQVLF
jgi:hypothetical protein